MRWLEIDNRWVVPHNPYLVREYDCHINLEICETVKAVKYLFKYFYKGHGHVTLEVNAKVPSEKQAKQRDEVRW